MKPLEGPAAAYELVGQPVEQLGMAGTFAKRPEIGGRPHDPTPEVVEPDAVDQHSRRERVLAAREVPRVGQAAAGRGQVGVVVTHSDYLATLLHQFGLDHAALTFNRPGGPASLVDGQPARVVKEVLANASTV